MQLIPVTGIELVFLKSNCIPPLVVRLYVHFDHDMQVL